MTRARLLDRPTTQETTDVYSEVVWTLPHSALAVADLPAVVRTAVDLVSSRRIFSQFEFYVGLPRIVHGQY